MLKDLKVKHWHMKEFGSCYHEFKIDTAVDVGNIFIRDPHV